jgi:hypothetical protein
MFVNSRVQRQGGSENHAERRRWRDGRARHLRLHAVWRGARADSTDVAEAVVYVNASRSFIKEADDASEDNSTTRPVVANKTLPSELFQLLNLTTLNLKVYLNVYSLIFHCHSFFLKNVLSFLGMQPTHCKNYWHKFVLFRNFKS